tara:strand:+ start:1905 stop:2207 length:303 start_codon:yes stop_codon:yes gene_type:complete
LGRGSKVSDKINYQIRKLTRLWNPRRRPQTIDWSNPHNRKKRWIEKNINFIIKTMPGFPWVEFMNRYEKGDKECKDMMEKISSARLRKEKMDSERREENK